MGKSSTSFKKGQSGNPNGAPKKEWTVVGMIEEAMEEMIADIDDPKKKKALARKLVYKRLIKMAAAGDTAAIREINNRKAGLPVQPIDQTVKGGLTIRQVSYLEDE